ncbi:MAG: hypothetical protein M9932_18350 [Xanthobacteraceae bacterium]|nr:hypothetical protein [Xanthobacteraceae bacterium]
MKSRSRVMILSFSRRLMRDESRRAIRRSTNRGAAAIWRAARANLVSMIFIFPRAARACAIIHDPFTSSMVATSPFFTTRHRDDRSPAA